MAIGSWTPVVGMWLNGIEWSGGAGRAIAFWYTVPALVAILLAQGRRDEYRRQVLVGRRLEKMWMFLDESDRKIPACEVGLLHDTLMERDSGIHASDDELVQSTGHAAGRFRS